MGYERTHLFLKLNSHTIEPTSQFSTRPFAAPVQRKPQAARTPDELENEGFNQHKFEAFGLQLKEQSGTITPVEQERLGVLQAKMDDFWALRLQRASRFGIDFSKVSVTPREAHPTPQLQPMWLQRKNGGQKEEDTEAMNSPQQLSGLPVQAKLTIGEPGDKYEQEADAVAAQVVEQIHAPATAQSTQGQSVQREAEEETEEVRAKPEISALHMMDEPNEEEIQGKFIQKAGEANAGGEASTDLESAINSARGGGQPIEAGLQQSMGRAMGADFSGVRVHTDAQADELNQSIQAKAFTTGQDVFFRQGAYEPGSRGGQELIAHELTHVVQQSGVEEMRGGCFQTHKSKTASKEISSHEEGRSVVQGKFSEKKIGNEPEITQKLKEHRQEQGCWSYSKCRKNFAIDKDRPFIYSFSDEGAHSERNLLSEILVYGHEMGSAINIHTERETCESCYPYLLDLHDRHEGKSTEFDMNITYYVDHPGEKKDSQQRLHKFYTDHSDIPARQRRGTDDSRMDIYD